MKTFLIDKDYRRSVSFYSEYFPGKNVIRFCVRDKAINKYLDMFDYVTFDIISIQNRSVLYNLYKNCKKISVGYNVIDSLTEEPYSNILMECDKNVITMTESEVIKYLRKEKLKEIITQ